MCISAFFFYFWLAAVHAAFSVPAHRHGSEKYMFFFFSHLSSYFDTFLLLGVKSEWNNKNSRLLLHCISASYRLFKIAFQPFFLAEVHFVSIEYKGFPSLPAENMLLLFFVFLNIGAVNDFNDFDPLQTISWFGVAEA